MDWKPDPKEGDKMRAVERGRRREGVLRRDVARMLAMGAVVSEAGRASGQTVTPQPRRLFVGVQLGPQSVFDEGPERCLDLLQETAGVNAVFVYSHTYQRWAAAGVSSA